MVSYFDHAATTPMRQVAVDTWVEHAHFLNPGGQYRSGREANAVLAQARETIAGLLGADPVEVIFTGSGTEADNLAIRGFAGTPGARIVSTPIEHPAVRETVTDLEKRGAAVDLLPAGPDGLVQLTDALDQPAAVVTCMWANNETGAIQPIADVISRATATDSPVHVDAVQVVGHLPVDFHALGATTLAASAHKFGGPRGVGILLARRSPAPSPVLTGGGQQRGLRPGTVDVAAAAATAAALEEAVAEMDAENKRLSKLRDDLIVAITHSIPDAYATVLGTEHPPQVLPGHAHLIFPGANGDAMIMLLDSHGIETSTGSACNSGVNQRSHVLEAMGLPDDHADGALRFTLGRTTTQEDIDHLIAVLPDVIEKARSVASL